MYFLIKGYSHSKVSNLHKSLEYHDNVVSGGQLPRTKNSLMRKLAGVGGGGRWGKKNLRCGQHLYLELPEQNTRGLVED